MTEQHPMQGYYKSHELYQRACRSLAGGVSSEFRKYGYPHPMFYERGAGSHIFDVDGNDYLDFTLSQGPLILGHSHPEVLQAVNDASAQGQLFAGQHLREVELAEMIQRSIPCAELMRFSLSGSEADHAAIRLARGYTGRTKILKFEGHYHGWFDNIALSVSAPNEEALGPRDAPHSIPWSAGLPASVHVECMTLPWNDLGLLEDCLSRHGNDLAAIITSPVMCNNGCIPPEPGYLEGMRTLCDKYGILLIFDEVITGFRLGMGGAQKMLGVTPDLGVFGKALANGYPISVLAGKAKFMDLISMGKVLHAGTMNAGNPSIAAAHATLQILERDAAHVKLYHLGRKLMNGLADASRSAGNPLLIQGYGPVFHAGFTELEKVRDLRESLSYNKEKYSAFVAGMHDRGIRLIGRGIWYVSAAHTEQEIDLAIATAYDVLRTFQK